MPFVLERLRAFLREIGPGEARVGLAMVLGALVLLVLVGTVISYALANLGREEAARNTGGEQYTVATGPRPEDFPLVFGPGPSPELAEAATADRRRTGIPGFSEMQVIGYLQHLPGTQFSCPGRGLDKWVCTLSSTDSPAVYEVAFHRDGPNVYAVVVTAYDASEDEAARVLGYVARLSFEDASHIDAEAWVGRTISSGGQYLAYGAEVRLYGTEQARTLEIVATAVPEQAPEVTDLIPEISELTIPEITEGTTAQTSR